MILGFTKRLKFHHRLFAQSVEAKDEMLGGMTLLYIIEYVSYVKIRL